MAKHRASGDDQLTRQGVIETPGRDYWSVDDSRWPTVRPDLPPIWWICSRRPSWWAWPGSR
ncbi:hypothetical protein JNW90_12290 [Micromonospora sp. STR1s_5]|nr:hypothetical protein [Micromonospora sp. STR1s_5]